MLNMSRTSEESNGIMSSVMDFGSVLVVAAVGFRLLDETCVKFSNLNLRPLYVELCMLPGDLWGFPAGF